MAPTDYGQRIVRARYEIQAAMVLALSGAILLAIGANSPGAKLEYRVKAAFIYNFAQFIEWPKDAFAEKDARFTIAVVGDDPFGDILEATVRGKKVKGRDFLIRRYRNVGDVKPAQILFISESEEERLPEVFKALKDSSVLTVSDIRGFAQNGGMVALVKKGKKIALEINIESAERARLKISSKLLKLAKLVRKGVDKEKK